MIKNRLKHKAAGILAALLITTAMSVSVWADPLPEETTPPEETAATEQTEPAETVPVETQAPVVPEETGAPIEYGFGLTPTGNMALQDDIEGEEAESIEFLTVTTRDNHIFYIVIEHTKNGNNVHFLNQVDDVDLRTLLSDEQVAEYFPEETGEETTESSGSGFSILGGGETEPDPTGEEDEEKSKFDFGSLKMLLIVVAVVAAIGGGYYFVKIKPKKDGKINEDAEFDDDEDIQEESENEDETESEETEETESEEEDDEE